MVSTQLHGVRHTCFRYDREVLLKEVFKYLSFGVSVDAIASQAANDALRFCLTRERSAAGPGAFRALGAE